MRFQQTTKIVAIGLTMLFAIMVGLSTFAPQTDAQQSAPPTTSNTIAAKLRTTHRSPVDGVLSHDGNWFISANQKSHTVSLVQLSTGHVASEIEVGQHPTSLALSNRSDTVYVVSQRGQQLTPVEIAEGKLRPRTPIDVGLDPYGVAISPDDQRAYVTQVAGECVAVIDLTTSKMITTIPVGKWPRNLALSPNGKRLAVACDGNRRMFVIDTIRNEVDFEEPYGGINVGQMTASDDGKYVYFPWMVYRHNPITPENIRRGWVLGSRIGRVRLDRSADREAFTLDVPGKAVSDPTGMVLIDNEKWLVSTGSGTHELLVYRLSAVTFESIGGPGDHINPRLASDRDAFFRIPLGGRPLKIQWNEKTGKLYVTNYLLDAIQVVDLEKRAVAQTISLGKTPAHLSLQRQGEALFYDGTRSLDQWYSCHSCHWEGGPNAVTMDTTNDGSFDTFKTVPSLANVSKTGPWTWHGWQNDLSASIEKSFLETMRGKKPSRQDTQAMHAYFISLQNYPSPFSPSSESLSAAALRGKEIFNSEQAGCGSCHTGPYFTDGEIHDVGQGSAKDKYEGYNTPSLLGVYQRVRLLHHGRAKSLQHLLEKYHKPHELGDGPELSEKQLQDLIAYLKEL